MKEIVNKLESDFTKYKLFLEILFSLSMADETRRDIYSILIEAEDKVTQIEDKRLSDLYSRVIEDLRAGIPRTILDSDYRQFFAHLINQANSVEKEIDSNIEELKKISKT